MTRKDENWLEHCPRCQNEEISPTDNYCKICGLNLKKIKDAIQVLIDNGVTAEQYEKSYKAVVKI